MQIWISKLFSYYCFNYTFAILDHLVSINRRAQSSLCVLSLLVSKIRRAMSKFCIFLLKIYNKFFFSFFVLVKICGFFFGFLSTCPVDVVCRYDDTSVSIMQLRIVSGRNINKLLLLGFLRLFWDFFAMKNLQKNYYFDVFKLNFLILILFHIFKLFLLHFTFLFWNYFKNFLTIFFNKVF